MPKLQRRAAEFGINLPYSANTPYINTIARQDQPRFPGQRAVERRIKSIVRWNAMAMVVRANRDESGIGGHISTYASAASLYEVGFNHFFHGKADWLDKAMPIVSMAGIAVIITIITASGRDSLLTIGFLLILAAILHNAAGYFLGYWACRFFKMPEQDCRTIALEVGMQNGGLASGIALEMGKVATVGLAPAVFGPWMNISGSSLATWWREKPIEPVKID